MLVEFTEAEEACRSAFRAFVCREIAPYADEWDRDERVPDEVVARLGRERYLGALVAAEFGGAAMNMVTFGLLNEEVGRGCSSVRSILTVHGMVQFAVSRWGRDAQKARWLPRLASGDAIGAFALTEAGAGSDAAGIETTAARRGDSFVLDGT